MGIGLVPLDKTRAINCSLIRKMKKKNLKLPLENITAI